MKSLLIVSTKGSSGRTTLTCLLARHLQCTCHWRVLVLDLAEPPRCAHLLARYRYDVIVSCNRVVEPVDSARSASGGCVHVLNANAIDGLLSHDDPACTRYYANLRHLLSAVAPWFDVCLVDAPALPDLRAVCAEALVDAVLSPIAVSPECINCASEVINGTYGVRSIRARLNPALRFTGILPVVAIPVAMKEAWVKVMETTLREWLIADPASPRGYAWLPHLRSVGRTEPFTPADSDAAPRDADVPEDIRAGAACLDVLAHRLEAIQDGIVPALRDAEVCDA
ncbi:ParA family protein [Paraburkholderia fungorum]|uniref:Cobalamin biosynthesis protein CobQ n=1 Tax=Paraburkholderia fungorum TaxID=134537 RepID=A0A3R7LC70_9BURK|nr:ParA family protein [Paraburkholderia fungorum]RKF48920.1 cobalamin biosynthesis protein CobQ [Paraburkholderia fungorum]